MVAPHPELPTRSWRSKTSRTTDEERPDEDDEDEDPAESVRNWLSEESCDKVSSRWVNSWVSVACWVLTSCCWRAI
jgi:hypothetical protein